MSAQHESRDSLVGRHACGCMTYWNGRPDHIDRQSEKTIARFIREGGEVRRVNLDDVRNDPNFMPLECPHTPKGWEREVERPKEPHERLRYKRVHGRNLSVVNIVIERGTCGSHSWPKGLRGGEVGKRNGKWWATTGWLDTYEVKADNGDEPRAPAEVLGPFDSQREAALALIPYAEARARAFGKSKVEA